MDIANVIGLTILFLAAALLYSAVGHGGASGYLAAMSLLGVAPESMRPTALALNILVATIATVKYFRAGCFSWSVFWPFTVTAVPFAFLGGTLTLPALIYKIVVGGVLLYAAYRLYRLTQITAKPESRPIPLPLALTAGLGIGLLSGLTGTGGGIFLSPLLLFTGWAETRLTAGVSAAFILANSLAGLLGQLGSFQRIPSAIPVWLVAVGIGGWIGSEYGSKRINNEGLRRVLAVVLAIAGVKLILA